MKKSLYFLLFLFLSANVQHIIAEESKKSFNSSHYWNKYGSYVIIGAAGVGLVFLIAWVPVVYEQKTILEHIVEDVNLENPHDATKLALEAAVYGSAGVYLGKQAKNAEVQRLELENEQLRKQLNQQKSGIHITIPPFTQKVTT